MISSQLPILQILIPLLAAPLCLLLRRGGAAWALTTAVSWLVLLIAAQLLGQVLETGVITYLLGGWAAPWGIEFRIDAANAFVLFIVAVISAVVLPFARQSVEAEIAADNRSLFYTAYLLCLTGLLGITITGDAFNVFVFLEISSLSTYTLISMGRDRRALTSAFQYLIMGTIGATFILIGVGLLYMMTGTLNMADLSALLPQVSDTRTVRVAFAFLTVGIGLKLAMFPLHLWLPNAYAYAPSAATAFLAATATKVAVYVLLRFTFTIFGAEFAFVTMPLGEVLLVLAVTAMFSASAVAIFQNDIKRMFAYSSVAQIGYMLLGISFASATGLTASVVHLFNHALAKGALFLLLGGVALRLGQPYIEGMAGLGRRMPWTSAGLVVGGLSLIGVPGTVGFISKWYLVLGALERGWWWAAVLVLLSSLLAVAYVWRLVETLYFRQPSEHPGVREAPFSMLLPAWLLVAFCIWFGLDTSLTVGAATQAAQALLGNAP